jgi:hypothetical protein
MNEIAGVDSKGESVGCGVDRGLAYEICKYIGCSYKSEGKNKKLTWFKRKGRLRLLK